VPLELRPWWPVIWKEKKVKTGDVEAADTLNESECSSERPKEIKRAGPVADAFLSAPSWAIVVDMSLMACSIWRQESGLVQGGGLFLKRAPRVRGRFQIATSLIGLAKGRTGGRGHLVSYRSKLL